MPDYENLLYAFDGEAVATLTFNRPEKLNALNAATLAALGRAFDDIAANDAIRVVILTGAGEKAFIAGADIDQIAEMSAVAGRDWGRLGQSLYSRIAAFEKPVIAAINGYALGGGLELAMACHIRIASQRARLGQPEIKLGVVPGWGGTQRLPRIVGRGRALEMLLCGDPVDAAEAHRIGLVNHVVAPEQLMEKAREIASRIIKNSPAAAALILQAVDRGLEMPLDAALAWEASQFGLSCATEDMKEGVRAFLGKREPRFTGR